MKAGIESADRELLHRLVQTYGLDVIYKEVGFINRSNALTIVANAGLHPIPLGSVHGELFIASNGNFDLKDARSAKESISKILVLVKEKLMEKSWSQVYILPFGPAVLSMNIKMLVYRVLHIEAVEIMHIGNQSYVEIDIGSRTIG